MHDHDFFWSQWANFFGGVGYAGGSYAFALCKTGGPKK